jgi:ABC-type transport system involved in multi-copper enzyme maturation permease subunit
MFMEIFRFELRQQLKGPLFWIFLAVFFAAGVAMTSSPAVAIGNAVGNVHINAPVVIASLSGAFAFIGTLFVVVFVAGALLRDFEQRTAETIFSTPVSRGAYLGGRFAAGFLVALLVVTAALLGAFLGTLMPWVDAARLGPMMPAAWAWSFGVMLLPDMLFVAALLFALAAATRSLLAAFVGVVVIIVLRSVAGILTGGLDQHVLAGLIDPYGSHALGAAVRYWTADAYNTQLPPLDGVLLGNRLLWLAISIALFVAGFMLFRADREGISLRFRRRRHADAKSSAAPPAHLALPTVGMHYDWRAHWRQFLATASMDTAGVLRGVLFLVMVALGLAFLTALLFMAGQIYGTTVYPVTHLMISDIRGALSLFLYIVVAFYAGELVWRNRTLGVNEVADALPTPEWVPLAAKALALTAVVLVFLLVGMIWTIGFQLLHGYIHLQLGLYVAGLLLAAVPLVLTGVLALVLQVLANNKFVGYLLFIVFLVVMGVLGYFDLDHNLYQYSGAPQVPYSDMNGFGHFLAGALWFDAYWILFALALMAVAALFWVRGTDNARHWRWREARARLRRRPLQAVLAFAIVGFVASGAWIFYNTNVLNRYVPGDAAKQIQADYEKRYAKYDGEPQPRVTAIKADVDIYPYRRKLHTHVHYTLVNKHDAPIDELYVNWNNAIPPTHVRFAPHATLVDDRRIGFSVYRLKQPLAPGASMDFDFDVDYVARGFDNSVGGMDFMLVHNGTFFTNKALFPSFGYNAQDQLTEKKDRRKYGLKEDVPRMPPLGDQAARANTYISNDADWIDFDTVVSTADDQTALAPGYLQKTWTRDGRRYFHYKMDAPILNFYAFLSARWAVRHVAWHGVDISVYFNPAHAWNVDDMIDSAEKSLDYYSAHFTPYQFRQLRILEFPGYRSYAQSFANTVPFSEAIGFIADLRDKDAINYPFYVTAHEVAHQWWAHQVIGANMQGSTMLSESLAQYSALMVMKHEYGANKMRRFLKYELDHYLAGRVTERVGEQPLGKVENQQYIHYNKGSVVFYALQDYIGEDVLDGILKGFLEAKGFQQPPYTTSKEFVAALKAGTDDKWDPLIDDLFWKITLFDDRVVSATAKKRADGRYDVTMKVHAAKYYADAKGKQTRAKMDIPVDIGVFARAADDQEGDEKVLYLAKRTVADGDSTITLTVAGVPYEVGIDPYNELVDRVSADNRKKVVVN